VGEITGKTRLDFFLISAPLLGIIDTVKYADRLSVEFDHKEVLMNIGRKPPVGRITIYDSTLNNKVSESIGIYAIYDTIANHLENRDNDLDRWLTQLDILIRNVELLTVLRDSGWEDEESRNRYMECFTNIDVIVTRIRSRNFIEQNFGEYSYRQLYEVVTIGIKNKLMEIQGRIKKGKTRVRDLILGRCDYMKQQFGDGSLQHEDAKAELFRYNDRDLKERAGKFKDFLDENNEKATGAFSRLTKEGVVNDDVSQIRNDNGEEFANTEARGEYIGKFYSELYKQKLDQLFGIEDFLTQEVCQTDWVMGKKLTEEESISLEGEVTLQELDMALNNSNFKSTSGWDGLGFKVFRKYWADLRILFKHMANETFTEGVLTETFRMGLIKIIPKRETVRKLGSGDQLHFYRVATS
jgi:hypothetical protein